MEIISEDCFVLRGFCGNSNVRKLTLTHIHIVTVRHEAALSSDITKNNLCEAPKLYESQRTFAVRDIAIRWRVMKNAPDLQ